MPAAGPGETAIGRQDACCCEETGVHVMGDADAKLNEVGLALVGVEMPVDVIVATPEDVERDRESFGTLICNALLEGRVLHERAG